MLPQYKAKSNLGIGAGLLLLIGPAALGALLASRGISATPALLRAKFILQLVGYAVFIWGCTMLAMAKGRSPAWGAFGLLSAFGLIPLVLLVDRSNPQ